MDDIRSVEKDNPVLADRRREYGEFRTHAQITQHLKHVIANHRENLVLQPLHAPAQEAMDMICHKIGRIANGNPHNIDSWRDISGYALRVVEHLEQQEKAQAGLTEAAGCDANPCPTAGNTPASPFAWLDDTLRQIAGGLSYNDFHEADMKQSLHKACDVLRALGKRHSPVKA